jgi:hypothetical protein
VISNTRVGSQGQSEIQDATEKLRGALNERLIEVPALHVIRGKND